MIVSVIIPTFNRYEIVINAIESVLIQDYHDIECIVIDDHSSDDSFNKLVAKYACDNRVKLVKNLFAKGAQGARNTGIHYSKSNFLCFLDSDDTLTEKSISTRIALFNNETILVYGDFIKQVFPNIIRCPNDYISRNLSLCPFSSMMVDKQKLFNFYPNYKLDESFEAWQDDDFVFDLSKIGQFIHCNFIVAKFAPIERVFSISQSKNKFVNNYSRLIFKRKDEIINVSYFHFIICKSLYYYFRIRFMNYKFYWINNLTRIILLPLEFIYKFYFNKNFI